MILGLCQKYPWVKSSIAGSIIADFVIVQWCVCNP